MTDNIFNFPVSEEQTIQNILDGLTNNNKEKIMQNIKILSKNFNTFDNNRFSVETLIEVEAYDEALDIIEEYEQEYLKDINYRPTMIKLFILSWKFEKANLLIQQLIEENENLQEIDLLSTLLEREKASYQQTLKKMQDQLEEKFSILPSLELDEQLQIIKKSAILENQQLIEIGHFLFTVPRLHQIARNSYLEILIQKNIDENFNFQWLGKSFSVNPSMITSLENSTIVTELKKVFEKQFEKDPTLLEVVYQEFYMHLLILFPKIEEQISDIYKWVSLYEAKYLTKDLIFDTEEQELFELKASLEDEVLKMNL